MIPNCSSCEDNTTCPLGTDCPVERFVSAQLASYGVYDIDATNYALELIGDRGQLDLAEFADAWRAL